MNTCYVLYFIENCHLYEISNGTSVNSGYDQHDGTLKVFTIAGVPITRTYL